MKIVVAGTGYVGFVHAAVCSEYGHEVYAYDNDIKKIEAFSSGNADAIEQYVNEPGLTNIVRETLGKSLFFTADPCRFTFAFRKISLGDSLPFGDHPLKNIFLDFLDIIDPFEPKIDQLDTQVLSSSLGVFEDLPGDSFTTGFDFF